MRIQSESFEIKEEKNIWNYCRTIHMLGKTSLIHGICTVCISGCVKETPDYVKNQAFFREYIYKNSKNRPIPKLSIISDRMKISHFICDFLVWCVLQQRSSLVFSISHQRCLSTEHQSFFINRKLNNYIENTP